MAVEVAKSESSRSWKTKRKHMIFRANVKPTYSTTKVKWPLQQNTARVQPPTMWDSYGTHSHEPVWTSIQTKVFLCVWQFSSSLECVLFMHSSILDKAKSSWGLGIDWTRTCARSENAQRWRWNSWGETRCGSSLAHFQGSSSEWFDICSTGSIEGKLSAKSCTSTAWMRITLSGISLSSGRRRSLGMRIHAICAAFSHVTNFGMACFCRVPKGKLEIEKVVECVCCDCRSCSGWTLLTAAQLSTIFEQSFTCQ